MIKLRSFKKQISAIKKEVEFISRSFFIKKFLEIKTFPKFLR